MGHQVQFDDMPRGLEKLARMAALSIKDALRDVPTPHWGRRPMLLCVAELERVGRSAELERTLFSLIQREVGVNFDEHSMVIAHGKVGVAVGLARARDLLQQGQCRDVLIVAADSLLSWPALRTYVAADRLLCEHQSDGLIPGEGAGALWVSAEPGSMGAAVLEGVGFAMESPMGATDRPLRADGLTHAIKSALTDAGREMHDVDFRISDLSGEQYFFKEASLALSRTLRQLKQEFDLWHPAESMGDAGAALGVAVIALAMEAWRKGYAKGPVVMAQFGIESGQRAAVLLSAGAAHG
jgi:3-oxoacyl-[acyl-carrier-protein] synthase-1